jgi:hypothetical protein
MWPTWLIVYSSCYQWCLSPQFPVMPTPRLSEALRCWATDMLFIKHCSAECDKQMIRDYNIQCISYIPRNVIISKRIPGTYSIQEAIRADWSRGMLDYLSVPTLLSYSLLSINWNIKIYRTKILCVLYGCETSSLTLREERRLRIFENRVLRIFGPKRDEITREWWKLHNEERNHLYFSPNIVRVINREWDGRVM